MEKEPEDRLNPLAYRVLQLLPNLYRRWAAMRLKDLAPWVEEWRLDKMFAGVGGQGAHDAAYETAIQIEAMKLFRNPLHRRCC